MMKSGDIFPQPCSPATRGERSASALLPRIKITNLLLEVDRWTGFSKHLTYVKTGAWEGIKSCCLTAILATHASLNLRCCAHTVGFNARWT